MKKNANEIIISKKVYVRHRPRVVRREGEELTDQDANKFIGSAFKGSEVLRGLSFDEEKRFLKDIIGVSPTSDKWEDSTKKYWSNIRVRVPYGMGLELEIGFKYQDPEAAKRGEAAEDLEIQATFGEPIKMSDYVLYRYCLVYGHIANTIEDVNNSNKIRFFLFSKEQEINNNYEGLELRKKAMRKFILITGDRELVDNVLTIYNDPMANKKGDKEKDIALSIHMDSDPGKFIRTADDPELKTKALIELAIMRGHLRRVENTDTIIYGDNTPIGNSINDAVAYLRNPRNLEKLNNIKAKLAKLDAVIPVQAPKEHDPVDSIVSDMPLGLGEDESLVDDDIIKELEEVVDGKSQVKESEGQQGIRLKRPPTAKQ